MLRCDFQDFLFDRTQVRLPIVHFLVYSAKIMYLFKNLNGKFGNKCLNIHILAAKAILEAWRSYCNREDRTQVYPITLQRSG